LVVNFGVKDFRDFIFELVVDFNQGWRRLGTIRNLIRSCEFQLGHMEDWVNCVEMIREVYGDRVSARSCNDVKWAKVLLREFFGGLSSVNVFCPHKYLLTNFEVRCGTVSVVCRSLITLLCLS